MRKKDRARLALAPEVAHATHCVGRRCGLRVRGDTIEISVERRGEMRLYSTILLP
jgi:hypothetical protein